MGTLKIGDIVRYKGTAFSENKGEVGTLTHITPCKISERVFGSIELLVPKEQPLTGHAFSTLTGITAPLKLFEPYVQGWEC
jgi:hypothetical protein